jgi:SpoVK/Ycf46/Vps4 family AAA+-type ATPase
MKELKVLYKLQGFVDPQKTMPFVYFYYDTQADAENESYFKDMFSVLYKVLVEYDTRDLEKIPDAKNKTMSYLLNSGALHTFNERILKEYRNDNKIKYISYKPIINPPVPLKKENSANSKKSNIEGITFSDIAGLEKTIEIIKKEILLPMEVGDEPFKRRNVAPLRSVLFTGPPGNGKTLLAKAISNETNSYFIFADAPSLLGKYVGESEKNVRNLFIEGKKHKPSIIFLDEADTIAGNRDGNYGYDSYRHLVNQLLVEMQALHDDRGRYLIMATNRLNDIDPAILRNERIDRVIEIPNPDAEARSQIFKLYFKKQDLKVSDEVLDLAIKKSDGMCAADIKGICDAIVREEIYQEAYSLKGIKYEIKPILERLNEAISDIKNKSDKQYNKHRQVGFIRDEDNANNIHSNMQVVEKQPSPETTNAKSLIRSEEEKIKIKIKL